MSESKKNHFSKDFNDWLKFYGIKNFRFSSNFPLNTITACRLAVAHTKPELIDAICKFIESLYLSLKSKFCYPEIIFYYVTNYYMFFS